MAQYPSAIISLTNPAGTTLLTGVDHAVAHSALNDEVIAIETALGTNSGTAVLKNATVGKFAVMNTGGTLDAGVLGTPMVRGGTIGTAIIGTSTVQGGTIASPVINVTSDATGDMYYRNSSGVFSRLAMGASGRVITTDGTTPSWGTVSGEPADGWTAASGTWSYSSGSVITINTDLSTTFSKGDKLRFVQGGTTEYFYLLGFGLASGTTTGTVRGDAGTPVANAAISSPYFSKKESPYAWPDWFNFTTTWGGYANTPAGTTIRYKLSGKMCTFYNIDGASGTSNATTATLTLPVALGQTYSNMGVVYVADNGSNIASPGHMMGGASSYSGTVYKAWYQGAFTTSGLKNVFIPAISYEWT